MSYQTILVHTDLGVAADDRVRYAVRLARSFGAQLVGSASAGISLRPTLRDEARMALQRFAGVVRDEGLARSETRLLGHGQGIELARQARGCDLVVVGHSDHTQCAPAVPAGLPLLLARDSGRPVLALPLAGWRAAPHGEALVAWDDSLDASQALGAALPLLRLARRVTLASRGDASAPREWLARRGIDACVRPLQPHVDEGLALLAEAEDCGATLLVVGSGACASGALLRRMSMPVLIAH